MNESGEQLYYHHTFAAVHHLNRTFLVAITTHVH